jgi:hypothetical protein
MLQSNNDVDILRALRAYQNNRKLNLRRAVDIYPVNSAALWHRQ